MWATTQDSFNHSIKNNRQKRIQEEFLAKTIDNKQITLSLRNIHLWISTLKRFLIRILPDSVDLNTPIELCLKQADLWSSLVCKEDIETIQIDETILLKHTYIILTGLEHRLKARDEYVERTPPITIRNSAQDKEEANSFGKSMSSKTIPLNTSRENTRRNMRGD